MQVNKKLILLSIVLVIMLFTTKVYAYSVDITLTSDSKLEDGQIVEVILKAENINATSTGINIIKGKLTYDENVFENYVVETKNGWKYEEQDNRILFRKESGVTSNEEIAVVKLKVKDGITNDSTDIKLTNITASGIVKQEGGAGDIKVAGTTIKLSKTNNPVIIKDNIASIGSSKTNEKQIPKAGENTKILFYIALFSVLVIVMYVKYRNIDR